MDVLYLIINSGWCLGWDSGANLAIAPWIIPAIISAVPAILSMFEKDPSTKSKTSYPGSQYAEEGMRGLLEKGKEGYGYDAMARMKRDTRQGIGNQTSASRVSAQQRMQRRDAPLQIQEGILDKVNTRGLEALSKSLTQVEQGNESQKLQALMALSGGRQNSNTQTTYPGEQGQAFGSALGNISNMMMMDQYLNQGSGGSSNNYDWQTAAWRQRMNR